MRQIKFHILVVGALFSVTTLTQVSVTTLAQDGDVPTVTYPRIAGQATTLEQFVPSGWRLERTLRADFNQDKRSDAVLLLRQDAARNRMKNDSGFGLNQWDSNPRMLVVALARADGPGYRLLAENHRLIPRFEFSTTDDPFHRLELKNNKVRVEIGYWASAGSWTTWTTSFMFRYQNACLRLIGYDRNELQRNTGETTDLSVNFLTGKIKTTAGNIGTLKATTTWSALTHNPIRCLESLPNGFDFDPAGK